MEFVVKFHNNGGYLVWKESEWIGLDHLDRARKQLGVELPAEKLRGQMPLLGLTEKKLKLTEEEARAAAGRFRETCKVHVNVSPPSGLNCFVCEKLVTDRDPETDEIIYAYYQREINDEALLQAWFEAGTPLEWDLSANEDEK